MTAYAIVQTRIHDPERMQSYVDQVPQIVEAHGGKYLSRDASPEVIEGEWAADFTILISFPSREAGWGFYNSPEYQAIVGERHAAADSTIVVLNGSE